MKYKFLSATMLLLFIGHVNGAIAEEKINPSDLTQVNSFVSGIMSNDGEFSIMGGVAGQYSKGNNFLGLVEHKVATKSGEDSKKPQDTRLRYFQVFDTQGEVVPDVGFSVDYMKSWKMSKSNPNSIGTDIVALGAIAKVTTPWDAFTLFPNVAYVTGKAKGNTGGKTPGKSDLSGYQLNLFSSIALDETGQYVVIQPQFMHMDAKNKPTKIKTDIKTFKVKTGYGAPISDDGLWWTEISHTYTYTQAKNLGIGKKSDNDHLIEASLSYYF